jgi:hypothetical protein
MSVGAPTDQYYWSVGAPQSFTAPTQRAKIWNEDAYTDTKDAPWTNKWSMGMHLDQDIIMLDDDI